MYEWLSNFKLYKVPKTFITKNPKYVKTKRKIKGLKIRIRQRPKRGLLL